MFLITHAIGCAAKSSSLGVKPLIYVAGDFDGADTSSLSNQLHFYKVCSKNNHKKGDVLGLILTNARQRYSINHWNGLGKNDHNITYAYATNMKYKSLLPIPVSRLERSVNIGVTV